MKSLMPQRLRKTNVHGAGGPKTETNGNALYTLYDGRGAGEITLVEAHSKVQRRPPTRPAGSAIDGPPVRDGSCDAPAVWATARKEKMPSSAQITRRC